MTPDLKYALNNHRSVLGENFQYLALKFKMKLHFRYKMGRILIERFADFVSNRHHQNVPILGKTIRELCISRSGNSLYNMYELEEWWNSY